MITDQEVLDVMSETPQPSSVIAANAGHPGRARSLTGNLRRLHEGGFIGCEREQNKRSWFLIAQPEPPSPEEDREIPGIKVVNHNGVHMRPLPKFRDITDVVLEVE